MKRLLLILLCFTGCAFGQVCGPPTYTPCVTTSTANPGTIAPIFAATSPTATTCSGQCQNATAYDTTLNPTGTDCITRITDGTTFPSGQSMGNLTFSGGDNDIMGSLNETYIGVNAGQVYVLHANTSGNCLQIVNTGAPAIHVAGPFGFSKVVDTRFYYLVSKTQLWQGDITSDTTWTQTELFDVTGAGGPGPSQCPGVNWGTFGTPSSGSIMGISQTDGRFAWAVGPGGQGTADWAFVWDRSLGCASVNFATGNYWTFCLNSCSSSTPATGTLSTAAGTCWGIHGSTGHGVHDMEFSGDGTQTVVTLQTPDVTPPAQGSCATSTIANQFIVWQVGTATTQWAYGTNTVGVGGPNSGAHESVGMTHYLTPFNNGVGSNTGANIRTLSNVASFTNFSAPLLTQDVHCSWPHPLGDDSYPWICASDVTTAANGGSLAPHYMQNVIYAWFPNVVYPPGQLPALFSHTFSCGNTPSTCPGGIGDATFGAQQSIGFVTQKGNYFCWASTMLQSLGNDNLSNSRADGFCARLGAIAPRFFVFNPPAAGSASLPTIYTHAAGGAVIIPWSGDSGPSRGGWETSSGSASAGYNFTNFDNVINTQLGYGAKSLVIILAAVTDGPSNSFTPSYVFTPGWATSISSPTGQLYLCADSNKPGNGSIPLNTCVQGGDSTAFPAMFQAPMVTAWQAGVIAVINHIKTASYASKISYIRVGGGSGGEWVAHPVLETIISPSTVAQLQTVWLAYATTIENAIVSQATGLSFVQAMNSAFVPYSFADAEGSLGKSNGFGIGNQGFQNHDIQSFATHGNACGCANLITADFSSNDFIYNFSTGGAAFYELQTVAASDPTFVGIPPAQTMGSLVPLIPFGIQQGGNNFEIYYQDWQVAYDPTNPNNVTYGAAYRALLSGPSPLSPTNLFGIQMTTGTLTTP